METVKDQPVIVQDKAALKVISRATTIQECNELKLWDKMKWVLDNTPNAAAVAAIQIGYPLRAALCRFVRTDGAVEDVKLVNPVFAGKDGFMTLKEGCLSFPGETVRTSRSFRVKVTDDLNGDQMFEEIPAAVVQHEMDHMDGILMFDRGSQPVTVEAKTGRNDPCPCGSGKKFKKCCGK